MKITVKRTPNYKSRSDVLQHAAIGGGRGLTFQGTFEADGATWTVYVYKQNWDRAEFQKKGTKGIVYYANLSDEAKAKFDKLRAENTITRIKPIYSRWSR